MIRYDCAIIGSGPAGLEAAINLKIRNKNFLLFGTHEVSRKVSLAPEINNYLGLPSVTGKELAQLFLGHINSMGIEILNEHVSFIYHMKDYFSIAAGNNIYEATTLILAMGVHNAATIKGEQELLGHGVGYCATCDAPLYKNKTVAVIGYNKESIADANFLSEIASKVYFVPMLKEFNTLKAEIEIIRAKPIAINGDKKASGISFEDSGQDILVDGIFIVRDSIAPQALLPGLNVDKRFIAVDSNMNTNISGCFAAGDCTGKPHQYIRAAGQGLIAAYGAVEYLDNL